MTKTKTRTEEQLHRLMTCRHHYVRATPCRYTVVFQCVDPPVPALYLNTNSERVAQRLFDDLKQNEIEQLGGGEFTLTLFDHKDCPRKIRYWAIKQEESDYKFGYVYAIDYKDSKTLCSFSYNDLVRSG